MISSTVLLYSVSATRIYNKQVTHDYLTSALCLTKPVKHTTLEKEFDPGLGLGIEEMQVDGMVVDPNRIIVLQMETAIVADWNGETHLPDGLAAETTHLDVSEAGHPQ